MNPAHYNFTAICMWNSTNYIEKCYILYKQLSISVEACFLIILLHSYFTCTASRLKLLSGTVPGKDLSMHPLKMPAVLQLYTFLQNIFVTETSNYTKRIPLSHTDHYHNTRAMNWEKLTTEELNRSIACHKSTQTKRAVCWYTKPIMAFSFVP